MEGYTVKIISIDPLTPDVLCIASTRPPAYTFIPGQATEVSINKPGWSHEKRPFTFTSLPAADTLEFIIKTYLSHKGVTNQLLKMAPGDELIIHDVWGAINYKGPGIFIAGGAGITPFISIFRDLAARKIIAGNRLLFANKTKNDIILEEELNSLLGDQITHILSEEITAGYRHGFIDTGLLRELIRSGGENCYVCGPPPMMTAVLAGLSELGIADQSIVVEL